MMYRIQNLHWMKAKLFNMGERANCKFMAQDEFTDYKQYIETLNEAQLKDHLIGAIKQKQPVAGPTPLERSYDKQAVVEKPTRDELVQDLVRFWDRLPDALKQDDMCIVKELLSGETVESLQQMVAKITRISQPMA